MRVLVADDDDGARLVTRAVLESLGHDCAEAADGETAWRAVMADRPSVIVTDWMMPGMDGPALCRRIRETDRDGYVYVVMVTSLGDRSDVLSGMRAGADDYLTKPLDPFELEARLLAAQRINALHADLARYRDTLAEMARTDPLTGLGNRRSMTEDLATLHARSRRHGRGYCLALVDVDRFKAYNDAQGHPAGDAALRAVAATLSDRAREGDSVYRYGGEEFLVLLPEQRLGSASAAMERMRGGVEALGIAHPGHRPSGVLTVSAGIACFVPERAVGCEQLLDEADRALYAAKTQGRNVVVASRPDHRVAAGARRAG